MIVKNYTGLPTAKIIDDNGQKYAVGIDDSGSLVILSGDVVASNHSDATTEDEIFWAHCRRNQQYIQLPPTELAKLIADSADEQYQLRDKINEI
jgi:hypothetical protein